MLLAPNLSLDLEGGIQHISNANTASRKHGRERVRRGDRVHPLLPGRQSVTGPLLGAHQSIAAGGERLLSAERLGCGTVRTLHQELQPWVGKSFGPGEPARLRRTLPDRSKGSLPRTTRT